jgi:hypothetical protein
VYGTYIIKILQQWSGIEYNNAFVSEIQGKHLATLKSNAKKTLIE